MTAKENPPGQASGRVSKENLSSQADSIMPRRAYKVKPELPQPLKEMTVMAASVLHLETLLGELQEERETLKHIARAFFEALKGLADIAASLDDECERRRFIDKSIRRAEREAARLKLPLWFWRPEENLKLKEQVYSRARFLLFDRKATVDDCFDLLREYVDECARQETPVTDEQLSGVIEYAFKKEVN